MICKNPVPELITKEEAVNICIRAGTSESVERSCAIYSAFIAEAHKRGYDDEFAVLFAMATVYDAGRIQGIREERKARLAKTQIKTTRERS